MIESIREARNSATVFARVANDLFSRFESSPSRVVSLVESWKQLRGLSLTQNDLLAEALSGVERGLYRSAHVMAWAAYIDFLIEKMASDSFQKLHTARPGWSSHRIPEELRDSVVEHQIVEAARDIGLLRKPEMKAALGQLAKRNECAHPTGYAPGLNESLGYVAEILGRIADLQPRVI